MLLYSTSSHDLDLLLKEGTHYIFKFDKLFPEFTLSEMLNLRRKPIEILQDPKAPQYEYYIKPAGSDGKPTLESDAFTAIQSLNSHDTMEWIIELDCRELQMFKAKLHPVVTFSTGKQRFIDKHNLQKFQIMYRM